MLEIAPRTVRSFDWSVQNSTGQRDRKPPTSMTAAHEWMVRSRSLQQSVVYWGSQELRYAHIKNCPAGKREDGYDPRDRKSQAGLLGHVFRIGTLILQRIRHRNRRSIEDIDAALFPKPLQINVCL